MFNYSRNINMKFCTKKHVRYELKERPGQEAQ